VSAEKVGVRQYAVLLRAHRSRPYRMVRPVGYLEVRAARRLHARGLLMPALGWPGCYKLTAIGEIRALRVIEGWA
jgi:hypothetical protein